MRKNVRILSLFLAMVLLFTSFSFVSASENATEQATVMRVQEVEALRETNSETYLMSDGTYECVVYAYDKYYADENDTLRLVDNTIVEVDTNNATAALMPNSRQYKNAANAFDVYFSDSGVPELNIQYEGKAITFSPLNSSTGSSNHVVAENCDFSVGRIENYAILSDLTATGDNTVTYTDVFADTDLVYVLENNALKEYVVLNSADAPNSFSFMFALDGVTLQPSEKYADFIDADGAAVFALDSLFAVDANGVITESLTYSFTPVKGTDNVIVTVTLDEDYLSSTDRAYPVIIDPTVMISSSETADACVCSYRETTNYQVATQLRTGMDSDYGIRRSYIKFEIPNTIPTFGVTNAVLEIEKLSGVAPTIRAYACSGYWHSGTITWANKPGYRTEDASPVSTQYSSTSTWYTMNVTAIVQSWLNLDYSNHGFVLKDITENNTSHWTTLYSSDAPSPHKPELHITYQTNITQLNLSTNITQYMNAGYNYQYSFTPSETGYYAFESFGSIDTYGSLFLYSTRIAVDDDSGSNTNFKILYRLSSGTEYHLTVKGYSSSTTGYFSVGVKKAWPSSSKPTIFPRSQWGASTPIDARLVPRAREPERIIYHHSAEKFSSTDLNATIAEIKRIQTLHMTDKGKCDIAYHFIIDPAGRIWQGAEIDDYQRGHAEGYFDDIGVLILGDFESRLANAWSPNTLNQSQKDAMIALSKWLCYEYDLSMDGSGANIAPISTHRTVDTNTVCPGTNAATWIEGELRNTISNWRS